MILNPYQSRPSLITQWNTHVYFDEETGDPIQVPEQPTPPPPLDLLTQPDDLDSSSICSAFTLESESESESESDYPSTDEEGKHTSLRTHNLVPNKFRGAVDMNNSYREMYSYMHDLKGMRDAEFKTLSNRVAEYIGWVMQTEGIGQKEAVDFVFLHPNTVIKYFTILRAAPIGIKAMTVYNHCLDIKSWGKYLAVYEQRNIVSLTIVLDDHAKLMNKLGRRESKTRFTREHLEANQEWPEGGKRELLLLLQKSKKHVDAIIMRSINGESNVKKRDLTFVNDWVISYLFVANPQGRSQAISELLNTRSQLKALSEGLTTSTDFKTHPTFGSQAISCNATTYKYIMAYVTHIRPQILGDKSTCEALFINMKGKQHKDVGMCVTRLFERNTRYHITTTALRSMFETEARDAQEEGLLTEAECIDVVHNNGHSNQTSKQHYLKRKAEVTSRNAIATHSKLYGTDYDTSSPPRSTSHEDDSFIPTRENDDADDDEKLFMSPSKRIRTPWTKNELDLLFQWVNGFVTTKGAEAPKDWASCLISMKLKSSVFAPHHLSATALRDAYRREIAKQSTGLRV